MLCGVDIGSYGSDFPASGDSLTDLLHTLMEIEGDFRIRLSSIDPVHLSDELIEIMSNNPRICPQLHLSLQSGNTLILKRMKRRATRELVYQRVTALREAVPDLVLSADILVGFPTESDQHFEETLDAIRDLEIAYPHVFSYSKRPGTPASRIPKQVPADVRKQRSKTARELGKQIWRQVGEGFIGKRLRVVNEKTTLQDSDSDIGGQYHITGRSASYYPVEFSSPSQPGSWSDTEIIGITYKSLIGRLVG